MKILSTSWFISKWCAGCARDLLLCVFWLALATLLIVQALLLTSHQLPMPAWMLRQIETRLTILGLHAQIGNAIVNTSGRVVLENLQLSTTTSSGPLLNIDALNLRLNPVALVAGHLDITQIYASGVDFLLPAVFSPTGRTEAVISRTNLSFKPNSENLKLEQLSGHLANVTFSAHGVILLPAATGPKNELTKASVAQFVKKYIEICQRLVELEPNLQSFDSPKVDLLFEPNSQAWGKATATFTCKNTELDLTQLKPEAGRVHLTDLRLSTDLLLAPNKIQTINLFVDCGQIHTSTGYEINLLQCSVTADLSADFTQIKTRKVVATAASILTNDVPLGSTWTSINPTSLPTLEAEIATRAIGTDWHASGTADLNLHQGTIALEGAITPFITQKLEDFFGQPHGTLLTFTTPPPFNLSATLGPDWKLDQIRGHIVSGYVVGGSVPINDILGDFTFRNNEINAYNIFLHQKENTARGIYWMNVKTLDFRFLLTGQLRPVDISGWFGDWWKNFWSNFDFAPSVPVGDVTVDGQWTFPYLTNVFAGVDVNGASINNVKLDHVRTVMFIRPEWYDATEFKITDDGRTAQGTFTRTVDQRLEDTAMRTTDFDITCNLDLVETAKIFGKEGAETLAPFSFAEPPTLRLKGHLDGEASGKGTHRNIAIDLQSRGGFALYEFPLYDLSFHGLIHDADIDLNDVQVYFARGQARAQVFLSGPETARRLRFDAAVENASIGETINTLEQFFAKQNGELPPPTSKFQHQLADGRLQFQLAADGLYSDPLSFRGHGSMELSGDQLARINLFGGLSQVLSKSPLFSFTALQLKNARSSFLLDQRTVDFPDLKIKGNSASIEGKGTFLLDKKLMDFSAKVYPFGEGKTLLANTLGFVLVPISNALELKLSGTLDEPNWYFAYGPTNFIYNVTGTKPIDADPSQPVEETPKQLPKIYLRR